jgi:hypothetical protein
LKAIDFREKEEHDLKVLLGIPVPKLVNREGGFGGGGNANIRKDYSMRKIENNQYSPINEKLQGSKH